jgi:branched-chain amino acid transport system ATP-binding protein
MIDLRVRDLAMSFGGNQVLAEVSFQLDGPQILGLIGPNGAGKSTLVNVLAGSLAPTGGAVLLSGERIDGLPPYAVARRGLGRTFQVSRAFRRLTVTENLLVPGHAGQRHHGLSTVRLPPGNYLGVGGRSTPAARRALAARAAEALELLSIAHLAHEPASALSGGQLKLLELARLLMLDATILLLDEPFAGVHPRLRGHISEFIRTLRSRDRGVVIIEHDMETIFTLSERLLVLAAGRLIADGPPDAVRADQRVIDAYLGTDDGEDPDGQPGTAAGGRDGGEGGASGA